MKSFLQTKPKINIKSPPRTRPSAAGMTKNCPYESAACSREGKSSDQNDAESIIPPAKPTVVSEIVWDGLLKKKIRDPPNVVIKQGKRKDRIVVRVWLILCENFLSVSVYEEKIFV